MAERRLRTDSAPGAHAQEEALRDLTRRLDALRGRLRKLMLVGVWQPQESLVQLSTTHGADSHVFGLWRDGNLFLRLEEALCLVEDGTLLLMHERAPCSVQAAHSLLFESHNIQNLNVYLVLRSLHRNGFVCRPQSLASPMYVDKRPNDNSTFVLIKVYERQGFSRRAADNGALGPLFWIAVASSDAMLISTTLLRKMCDEVAPVPLRCANVAQGEVVFFEVSSSANPSECDEPCSAANAAAWPTAPHSMEGEAP